jgi:RNA polymerase sigma-54 factor
MTPQLQQAIRLLQLSALQLKTEVQDALDSNLMLEVDEEGDSADSTPEAKPEETTPEDSRELGEPADNIPDELPVDTDWTDIYEPPTALAAPPDDLPDIASRTSAPTGLGDHLLWQMNLARFSEQDECIATVIIDAISDDGYVTASLDEIVGAIGHEEVGLAEVEAVLHRIQSFDPPGVGARDTRESLTIQLRQLPEDVVHRGAALRLVENHFDLLAHQERAAIERVLRMDPTQTADVIRLIQSLNPRPGVAYAPAADDYIVPDIIVSRRDGGWRVELNPDITPRLKVNPLYASYVQRADSSASNTTLRTHLQEARWLIKSLKSRNETLLRVAREIVERQTGFFEHGPMAMRPMILRDIAEALSMHESTVSRVTSQKYMLTPQGVFELKYFFSSHVGSTEGGEVSATAIRAMIRQLVESEPAGKPYSDNKLAGLLEARGVAIARRTVAKYREAMAIPPSNERKRLL